MTTENEKKYWQWLFLTLFNITLIYKSIPLIGLVLSLFLILNQKNFNETGSLKIILVVANVISFFLSLYFCIAFSQTLIQFLPGWLEFLKK